MDIRKLERLERNYERGVNNYRQFRLLVWDWFKTNISQDRRPHMDEIKALYNVYGLDEAAEVLEGLDPFAPASSEEIAKRVDAIMNGGEG